MTTIKDFPAVIQPILEQGFLRREFEDAIRTKSGFRWVSSPIKVAANSLIIGKEYSNTRPGLLISAEHGTYGLEKYSTRIYRHPDRTPQTVDLSKRGICSELLQNAYLLGQKAISHLETNAAQQLYDACTSGNTYITRPVVGTLDVPVDDIRGFETVSVDGRRIPLTNAAVLTKVSVGDAIHTVWVVIKDDRNISRSPGGISGVLRLTGAVSAPAGTPIRAAIAPTIHRPHGKTLHGLRPGEDTLSLACLHDAVADLEEDNVPTVGGYYNCYLDPISAKQLFADPAFKTYCLEALSPNQVFRRGRVHDQLNVRFYPTVSMPVLPHPSLDGSSVHRVIVCGADAVVETRPEHPETMSIVDDAVIDVVDGICMVTQKEDNVGPAGEGVITQSWYWVGGFGIPYDLTAADSRKGPGAKNAEFKRAVVIEHIGEN